MLPKKQRLTTEAFDHHFKIGKRHHGLYVQIIVSPESSFHGSVVVGKKVYKNAVDRNRLRRRLYDVIRNHAPKTGIYICIVKPSAKTIPFSIVRDEVKGLLAKVVEKQVQ